MKFSIIVPIYNVEKYIEKCMESINGQTYKKYEVLLINDGSPDNSEKIIKKYIKGKDKFKYFKKTNGGLSDARNYGAKKATGEYLLFVDSDDYISPNLLEELDKSISLNACDVVKFNYRTVYENGKEEDHFKTNFQCLPIDEALKQLLKDEMLEPAWLYCYKREFWEANKFEYYKGRVHEDYGLTPLVLMSARTVSSVEYVGYNYLNRDGSITNSPSNEKLWKRFNDCYNFWKENIPLITDCTNINTFSKKLLISFYTNGIIDKVNILNKSSQKKASKILRREKIHKYLLDDTFKRKIKKILIIISPYIYIHVANWRSK